MALLENKIIKKEKKWKRNINIDLALVASQSSERWFMILPPSQDSSS